MGTRRLWWRCTLCRHRFDTFGADHESDRFAAADLALTDHFDPRHPEVTGGGWVNLRDIETLIEPDGHTSRVVRKTLITAPTRSD